MVVEISGSDYIRRVVVTLQERPWESPLLACENAAGRWSLPPDRGPLLVPRSAGSMDLRLQIFRMMRNTCVFWRPLRQWWGPGPFKCTKQKLVAHPCRSSTGCWLSLGLVFWRARWEGGGVTILIPALLPFQQARLPSLLLTQLLLHHR